jgi:hypothetical protein
VERTKKTNKVLLIFLILLLILLLPLLALSYFGSQTRQLHAAEHFFQNNRSALEDSINVLETALTELRNDKENYIELKKPSILSNDVDSIYWVRTGDGNQAYVLFLGAFGIVPSGSYYGLYYSINDKPCNLMEPLAPEGLKQDKPKQRDSEIWTWQQQNGDNSYYTERIAPHWFTYRQTF